MAPQNNTDNQRIAIKGHEPLSQTTIHGWPAIGLGLIIAVMGLPILGIGLEWIPYSKSKIHAPYWVIQIAGGLFTTCGIWLLLHGVSGLRRIWNMTHGKKQLPNSPWLWDYDWNAQGITDNTSKKALGSLYAVLVFGLFLLPFNWLAYFSESGSIFWQVLVGIFDIVVIIGVGSHTISKLKQYFMYGNSYLGFNNFPFFLGDTLSVTLKRVPNNMTRLRFELRCIEEAYEESGTHEDRKSVVVCYQRYKDSKTITRESVQPRGDLHLSWNLPNNSALTSRPSERPATFWELEVISDRDGSHYRSRFLLPVYAH